MSAEVFPKNSQLTKLLYKGQCMGSIDIIHNNGIASGKAKSYTIYTRRDMMKDEMRDERYLLETTG